MIPKTSMLPFWDEEITWLAFCHHMSSNIVEYSFQTAQCARDLMLASSFPRVISKNTSKCAEEATKQAVAKEPRFNVLVKKG